jgi:hypothetical protein
MTTSTTILLALGLLALARGVPAALRPDEIAARNRKLIDSGEEEFFEQRRSWKTYGTMPSTDAALVQRAGRRWVMIAVFPLVVALLLLVTGR